MVGIKAIESYAIKELGKNCFEQSYKMERDESRELEHSRCELLFIAKHKMGFIASADHVAPDLTKVACHMAEMAVSPKLNIFTKFAFCVTTHINM